MVGLPIIWQLQTLAIATFSFGGYGLALCSVGASGFWRNRMHPDIAKQANMLSTISNISSYFQIIIQTKRLFSRLPHIKCITLNSMRIHLSFKMHYVRTSQGLQALSVQFRFAFSKPYSSQTRFLNRPVAALAEVAHFCGYKKKIFFDQFAFWRVDIVDKGIVSNIHPSKRKLVEKYFFFFL